MCISLLSWKPAGFHVVPSFVNTTHLTLWCWKSLICGCYCLFAWTSMFCEVLCAFLCPHMFITHLLAFLQTLSKGLTYPHQFLPYARHQQGSYLVLQYVQFLCSLICIFLCLILPLSCLPDFFILLSCLFSLVVSNIAFWLLTLQISWPNWTLVYLLFHYSFHYS